jgi:hypothetical protein
MALQVSKEMDFGGLPGHQCLQCTRWIACCDVAIRTVHEAGGGEGPPEDGGSRLTCDFKMVMICIWEVEKRFLLRACRRPPQGRQVLGLFTPLRAASSPPW